MRKILVFVLFTIFSKQLNEIVIFHPSFIPILKRSFYVYLGVGSTLKQKKFYE